MKTKVKNLITGSLLPYDAARRCLRKFVNLCLVVAYGVHCVVQSSIWPQTRSDSDLA